MQGIPVNRKLEGVYVGIHAVCLNTNRDRFATGSHGRGIYQQINFAYGCSFCEICIVYVDQDGLKVDIVDSQNLGWSTGDFDGQRPKCKHPEGDLHDHSAVGNYVFVRGIQITPNISQGSVGARRGHLRCRVNYFGFFVAYRINSGTKRMRFVLQLRSIPVDGELQVVYVAKKAIGLDVVGYQVAANQRMHGVCLRRIYPQRYFAYSCTFQFIRNIQKNRHGIKVLVHSQYFCRIAGNVERNKSVREHAKRDRHDLRSARDGHIKGIRKVSPYVGYRSGGRRTGIRRPRDQRIFHSFRVHRRIKGTRQVPQLVCVPIHGKLKIVDVLIEAVGQDVIRYD